MIEISVIIPHLDATDDLARCVAALETQSLARASFEIIVADNGSACGADVVQATAPSARVVSVAERGAGPARNAGVAASSGRILAFTDSDCVPDRAWLANGKAALANADIIGGAMRVTVADPKHMTGPEAFEAVFAFDNRTYVERRGFSVTANLMTTRAVFDAAGPFAKSVSEDVMWCRTAAKCGYRLAYVETAVVTHPARYSFADLQRKWRRLTSESYAIRQAEGRGRVEWLLRAAVVLISPLGHALRILTSGQLPDAATRMRALATLVRIRSARAGWMLRLALSPPTAAVTPAGAKSECTTP